VDVVASAWELNSPVRASRPIRNPPGGSAYADPTFAIDDPAFAITRLSACRWGPAAAAAPEPATWAMMLPGFAGLGYARYRKAKGNALLAA